MESNECKVSLEPGTPLTTDAAVRIQTQADGCGVRQPGTGVYTAVVDDERQNFPGIRIPRPGFFVACWSAAFTVCSSVCAFLAVRSLFGGAPLQLFRSIACTEMRKFSGPKYHSTKFELKEN